MLNYVYLLIYEFIEICYNKTIRLSKIWLIILIIDQSCLNGGFIDEYIYNNNNNNNNNNNKQLIKNILKINNLWE